MTLVKSFLDTCKKYPRKVAVIDLKGETTYDALLKEAEACACLVQSNETGKNIGILLINCKEFVSTFYGILMAGKTPVPLNFLLSPAQLHFVIQNADINTVFTTNLFKPHLEGNVSHIILTEEIAFNSSLKDRDIKSVDDEDVAALLYTSGTSANPKGVMLTHRNFLSNLEGCVYAFDFTEKAILLGMLPLFHTYALTTTLVLPVYMGATVVYLPRFSGPKVLEIIEKCKITAMFAIPSMYRVLLRTAETTKYDISSLKLCTSGGELLPRDVLEAFNRTFPVPITEGYGLTESTAIVSVNLPKKFKYGSIGLPLRNLDVRIISDDGKCQPVNMDGEIWLKGPNVMKGYYKLPKETSEAITPDGWLKTGDYGRLDEEGFLWITGRKKELIIISGENVSPNEIEHVISGYEKVFEVAVIGMPDKLRGEVPKAYIALREKVACGEDEIRTYCMQHLPHYKVPKYFEFLKELPHGPTGKVLKRALK